MIDGDPTTHSVGTSTVIYADPNLLRASKKAQRVDTLRSVARTKAKKFWPGDAAATPVADGVQVSTPKVGATGSWYFRIRNAGTGIKVTDNLP